MSKDAESRERPSALEHVPLEEAPGGRKALEPSGRDAVAIIGMGCRFPGGANSPKAFWQLLRDGQDAIQEIPADRFRVERFYDQDPDAPGKISIRHGGFINQIQDFDSDFFHISPREVVSLDPQQRLLLEVSWEALENAGLAPERLAGSQTGVFIGICSSDYSQLLLAREHAEIDVYLGSGIAHSVASGRLSYLLGLQGPSLSVDTACSSSLVAVHLACQSLLCGECNLALVGGVNLILAPEIYMIFSRARMLAADGRCKTFDAAADGYARSEGCGVIVLKRLADAVADGDNIRAVIRGSAMNQDGRTSGLTVPNGPAQQAVMRKALENAGIEPTLMQYVEAHGTGTSLGDPIEVQALGAVFAKDRSRDDPLIIGSVKTNLGHLEGAAGIAGLIKAVLCLQNEEIPPHLHFKRPNPHIRWSALPVVVPTERMPWPAGQRRRIAGVSSFGFSGTNVHAVLEEAPVSALAKAGAERHAHLLVLSTRTEAALAQLAGRYVNHLTTDPTTALGDVCFSANTGRSHFNHRLAVVAESPGQAQEKLATFADGKEAVGVIKGQVRGQTEVAYLFTGQGSQYVGMGRELYETQPTFRRVLEHCGEILRSRLECSLVDVLYPAKGVGSALDETAYTQPALFALEYALAELWKSWGIEASVVLGHSVGEYVAACVAGVFSLEDGLKLIAERGRLMQALPRDGEMVAVFADEVRVAAACRPYASEVSIAAINGPQHVVISGRRRAVQQIVAGLEAAGIRVQKLQVSHAFHSPLMEPMLEEFGRAAWQVTYRSPNIGVISNVSGQLASAELVTAAYWVRHVRQPVRFAAGIEALCQELGAYSQEPVQGIFLEIGPHPVLVGMGRLCLPDGEAAEQGQRVKWLHSLRRGQPDWQSMLHSLGELYVRGVPIDWAGLDRDYARRRVVLPTYPFQRERFWIKPAPGGQKTAPRSGPGNSSASVHPLLGRRLYVAGSQESRFECAIGQDSPALVGHHRIHDTAVFPATAYLEMALAAGAAVFKSDHIMVEQIVFQQALIVPEEQPKTVQVLLTPEGAESASFKIFSCAPHQADEEPSWTLHVFGKVGVHEQAQSPAQVDLVALQARCSQEQSGSEYYQRFGEGDNASGSFHPIAHIWRRDGEALGQIRFSPEVGTESGVYQLHPAVLNGCFQVLGAAFPEADEHQTYIPVGIERLVVFARPGLRLWGHVSLRPRDGQQAETITGEVRLLDETGQVLAVLEGLSLKRTSREALLRATTQERVNDWLYQVEWQPKGRLVATELAAPAEYMPTPRQIAARVQPQVAGLSAKYGLERQAQLIAELESLSVAYVLRAFGELGEFRLGERITVDSVAERMGIVARYRRLLGRLLVMLEEQGVLQKVGPEWEVARLGGFADPSRRLAELLEQYPGSDGILSLLGACGPRLAQVWCGAYDPLQVLFPGGALTAVEKLYHGSPGAGVCNTLVKQVIATALERRPARRTVRILEIGGGSGGTTAAVLPGLGAEHTEYFFTDLSPLFLSKAEQRFGAYPFVRYQVLDIDRDPLEQGFGLHQFDVIVAANVLHATSDLRRTLRHVQELLAPQGLMVLLENTRPQGWVDLTFGLTEGWWKFVDTDLRPSYPLLSRRRWLDLLQELGFTESAAIGAEEDSLGDAVIVARGPQATPDAEGGGGALPATQSQGPWVIFTDRGGVGQQLRELLQERGERCFLVSIGETYEAGGAGQFRINPARRADFEQLFQAVLEAAQRPCRGVVHLWSLEALEPAQATVESLGVAQVLGCGSVLHVVQALVGGGGSAAPALWLVTRGAQPAGAEAMALEVLQTPLWGLGRVIALEHPELWGGLVDLDAHSTAIEDATTLLAEICQPDGEDQLAWRGGERYVARLVRSGAPSAQTERRLHGDGTYLITGGLGGLGLKVAHWLAQRGARHLVLTGRRGLPERAEWARLSKESENFGPVAAIEAIEALGATVTVEAADVSDMARMSALLAHIDQSARPLRGIVHAALAVSSWTLREMPLDGLLAMLQPKVMGTWVLHQLTRGRDLDFFVLFSSTTALWGSAALAHYAAANVFLDGFAHYRRALGLPALSINWGTWDVMRTASAEERGRIAQFGLRAMPSEQALAVLGDLLGSTNMAQVTIAAVDWNMLKPVYETKRERPFLECIATGQRGNGTRPSTHQPQLLHQLKRAQPGESRDLLVAHVRAEVAQVLGIDPSRPIDVQQGLFELGMDSLMSIELKGRLEASVGQSLPSTLVFNYPTVSDLAGYLATHVLTRGEAALGTATVTPEATSPQRRDEQLTVRPEADELSEDQLAALLVKKLDRLH